MRFVDVKNDVAFRKIFGNEKKTEILISFLNAVLKFEGEKRIVEVSMLNPYQLPRVAGEKASIIDVNAKDGQGRQFVIEMQMADEEGFDKRVQYYTCRDYSMQIKRGQEYPLLKPTFFVGKLGKHIPFREAISALHDVVVSDLRFKPKDKTAYLEWAAEQEKIWLGEHMAEVMKDAPKVNARLKEIKTDLTDLGQQRSTIMQPY